MPPACPQIVLVEWTGATADQVEPRLRAKQVPALEAAARLGRWATLSPQRASTNEWPWPARFAEFEQPGAAVFACGWNDATGHGAASRVAPDEIDARVVDFFPRTDAVIETELRTLLARLYSTHNAVADAATIEPPLPFVAARYDLLEPIARLYAHSPHLPHALLAAHRLLDLLLADLNSCRTTAGALVVCAPPRDDRSGFSCLFSGGREPTTLPNLSHVSLLPGALLALLGRESALPFAPNAAWLQPEFVPAHWSSAPRVSGAANFTEGVKTRAASTAEQAQLATLFPDVSWPAGAPALVQLSVDHQAVHAAASIDAGGALSVAFAPAFPFEHGAAAPFLDAVLGHARTRGLTEIFLRHPVVRDSALHRALERAGFESAGEQTLWLATVPAMLERARRLAGKAGEGFRVRPLAAEDIEPWRHRREGERLLRAQLRFDPDLSSAAFRGDTPAGLLIARRLDGRAWVDVMCIADDARLAGCFVPMAIQALTAGIAAGTLEVIFVTDESSRLAATFARRCGARVLQQGLRLRARINS